MDLKIAAPAQIAKIVARYFYNAKSAKKTVEIVKNNSVQQKVACKFLKTHVVI